MGRMGTYTPTPRTTPTRARQRVSYDRAAVHAVLDEAIVCHVGFVADGLPVVLPHVHARVADRLYLHGSVGARALRQGSVDVCVTVTLVDGLVLARSAFHHSINYRSVVAHGTARLVHDPAERDEALRALVNAVEEGRADRTRPPDRRELAATAVLRLDLEEVSLKRREGPPVDDQADLAGPYWAGVIPLSTTRGAPEPDLAGRPRS
jgi:nitroimidazol reductase NimA-like FMN-containing flavoprotein (pyridoxamine 5'-phosphate oxidase superfamily)